MAYKLLDSEINPLTISETAAFFKKVDDLFVPKLSKRTDLRIFSKKLVQSAEILYFVDEQESKSGLIAFYANDHQTKIAYITMIVVIPEYQGYGLSKLMLKGCFDKCREKGMNCVDLHTNENNDKASSLYKGLGFILIGKKEKRLHFRLEL